jgi:hypothetical protein
MSCSALIGASNPWIPRSNRRMTAVRYLIAVFKAQRMI